MNKRGFFEKNNNMNLIKYKKIMWNILIGFLAGIVSGFFSAGGGLLLVPYMTLFLKRTEVESRATTIMCIFFMVLTSSFFYMKNSYIDWNLAIKCIIGGLFGGIIGSKLLIKLDKKFLQLFFIIFLVYAGIKMICK